MYHNVKNASNDKELRKRIRDKMGYNKNAHKEYKYSFKINSNELEDQIGDGTIRILVRSNNPDMKHVRQKVSNRARQLNLDYREGVLKRTPPVQVDEVVEPSFSVSPQLKAIIDKIKKKDLNIIYNKGTDTTTVAILGSSFAAGKTTIMMNAIFPLFYGKYNKSKKKDIGSKKVHSPASLSLNQKPVKEIRYVCTLFSVNTHIDAYKGYSDFVKVNGFGCEQQDMIRQMHTINVKTDNKYRFALFFDDILDTRHSILLDNCFLTYRNAEISTCLCTQYLMLLNKKTRGNVQNLIFCKFLSDEMIESAVNIYLKSYFKQLGVPKEDWIIFYRVMTDKFSFIHLHQASETITFCNPVNI